MGQLSPYISAWWAGTKVQEEQKMGRRVGIAEGRLIAIQEGGMSK